MANDLVARLRWLAENDRPMLLQVLATVDPRALQVATSLAARGHRHDNRNGRTSAG